MRAWLKEAFTAFLVFSLLLWFSAAILLALWPGRADASPQACAPRDAVLGSLSADFGEVRQFMGLGANNALVELFAADATGTWTITVTTAEGVTCLVAAGTAFEALKIGLPAEGDPL